MTANPGVREYMTMKVITADASDSVFDVATKMIEGNVGCVVITQNDDIAGIVTKGDIIRNTILKLNDPKKMRASSIMVTPVVTISPDESLEIAAKRMSERHVSKLPVIDDESGLLVGVITSGDIMRLEPSYVEFLKELITSSQKK
jgi:CBS domain-containing protein